MVNIDTNQNKVVCLQKIFLILHDRHFYYTTHVHQLQS